MLRLKELRIKYKYTQQEIADMLKISRGAYANIENERREPDFNTLTKLADFYNVSTDFILGRNNISETNEDSTPLNLSPAEQKKIDEEAARIRSLLMASVGTSFEGEIEDEETLEKVMAVLTKGLEMARKDAKEKFTPKKYRQNKQ